MDRGMSSVVVGCHSGVNKSNICFIMKNEDISRNVKARVMVICEVYKDTALHYHFFFHEVFSLTHHHALCSV